MPGLPRVDVARSLQEILAERSPESRDLFLERLEKLGMSTEELFGLLDETINGLLVDALMKMYGSASKQGALTALSEVMSTLRFAREQKLTLEEFTVLADRLWGLTNVPGDDTVMQ